MTKVCVAGPPGGMSLRLSSAADILTSSGLQRSSKSVSHAGVAKRSCCRTCLHATLVRWTPAAQVSPIQTEADEIAFGSREEKIIDAGKQRKAFDANARLLTPIFAAVSPPLPFDRRRRGELGQAFERQRTLHRLRRDQRQDGAEVVDAKTALMAASTSTVPAATAAVLRPKA